MKNVFNRSHFYFVLKIFDWLVKKYNFLLSTNQRLEPYKVFEVRVLKNVHLSFGFGFGSNAHTSNNVGNTERKIELEITSRYQWADAISVIDYGIIFKILSLIQIPYQRV